MLDAQSGKSKGFAFIEMADEDEAKAAIAALHETMVAKSRMRVKIAQ